MSGKIVPNKHAFPCWNLIRDSGWQDILRAVAQLLCLLAQFLEKVRLDDLLHLLLPFEIIDLDPQGFYLQLESASRLRISSTERSIML